MFWEGTWSGNVNGVSVGRQMRFFMGDFYLDPDKETWERFWSETPYRKLAFSGDACPW